MMRHTYIQRLKHYKYRYILCFADLQYIFHAFKLKKKNALFLFFCSLFGPAVTTEIGTQTDKKIQINRCENIIIYG